MNHLAERIELEDEFENAHHDSDDFHANPLDRTADAAAPPVAARENDLITDVDDTEVTQAHPKIRPQKQKGRGSVLLSCSALVIALAAGGAAAKSYMNTQQLRADVNSAYDALDEQVAALGVSANDLTLSLAMLEGRIGENASAISGIDTGTIQFRVDNVQVELNKIARLVDQNHSRTEQVLLAMQAETSQIESRVRDQQRITEMLGQVKTASAKPSTSPSRPAVAPVRNKTTTSIEGAELISVDLWGYDTNLVLRDTKTGEFITRTLGDNFRGWDVKKIAEDGSVATFSKGSQILRVKRINS